MGDVPAGYVTTLVNLHDCRGGVVDRAIRRVGDGDGGMAVTDGVTFVGKRMACFFARKAR